MARRVSRGLIGLTRAEQRDVDSALHRAMDREAGDDFNELPEHKRRAREQSAQLGHQLGPWHRRRSDPAGRWNAYCSRCNAMAVVGVEPAPGVGKFIYGHALEVACRK